MDSSTSSQLIDSVFAGGGDMGARMRAVDWSTTVLGPVEQWPQSLRACVRIVLGAGHPMLISWGPEYTMLYNDAYGVVVGTKHPGALGRSCREVLAEAGNVALAGFNSVEILAVRTEPGIPHRTGAVEVVMPNLEANPGAPPRELVHCTDPRSKQLFASTVVMPPAIPIDNLDAIAPSYVVWRFEPDSKLEPMSTNFRLCFGPRPIQDSTVVQRSP